MPRTLWIAALTAALSLVILSGSAVAFFHKGGVRGFVPVTTPPPARAAAAPAAPSCQTQSCGTPCYTGCSAPAYAPAPSCGCYGVQAPAYAPAPCYSAPAYAPAPTYAPAPSYGCIGVAAPAPAYYPAPSCTPSYAPTYAPAYAPSCNPAPTYCGCYGR